MAILIPAKVAGVPRMYHGTITIAANTSIPTDCFDLCPPNGDENPLRLYRIQVTGWTAGSMYFRASLDGSTFYRSDTNTGAITSVFVTEQSFIRLAAPEDGFPARYLRPYAQNTQTADATIHCWFIPFFGAKG